MSFGEPEIVGGNTGGGGGEGSGTPGNNGTNGWSPVDVIVEDGARRVKKLSDYIGGTGVKPTANVGKYYGNGVFVVSIADAVEVRGPVGAASTVPGPKGDNSTVPGPKGDNGASPTIEIGTVTTGVAGAAAEAYMDGTALERVLHLVLPVAAGGGSGGDGEPGTDGLNAWTPSFFAIDAGGLRFLGIDNWTGGDGAKPATGFFAAAGGLTQNPGEAQNFRGPAGTEGARGNNFSITDTPGTLPSPALNDINYAPTSGAISRYTGSTWVAFGNFKGTNGTAATVAIGTVTTGAVGSNATVVNSGTSAAAILDISLPRGAQGTQGTTGTQGVKAFATPVPWATNTVYTGSAAFNVSAAAVTINGSLYVCTTGHTSGVFATDLAAGKWLLIASKGDAGSGVAGGAAGQVLIKNSATDFDTVWANRRVMLTADTTWYVRPDGMDTNNGLTNSAGGAFKTLQGAYDSIQRTYDFAGYAGTLQAINGPFTAGLNASLPCIGGLLTIQGNLASTSSVVVGTTNSDAFQFYNGINVAIKAFKLTTTTGGTCVRSSSGAIVSLSNVEFGACAGSHITAADGGRVTVLTNYAISGGATYYHWQVTGGGQINCLGRTITLNGVPVFAGFAIGFSIGIIKAAASAFVGAAAGQRYAAYANAVIDSGGMSATAFPGDGAGIEATGGRYV